MTSSFFVQEIVRGSLFLEEDDDEELFGLADFRFFEEEEDEEEEEEEEEEDLGPFEYQQAVVPIIASGPSLVVGQSKVEWVTADVRSRCKGKPPNRGPGSLRLPLQ